MRDRNKIISILNLITAILLFLATLIGKNHVYVPIGCCFLLSKYVSQKMVKYKNGKIVNISCIRSKIFRSNMADYAASKGGVSK